MVEAETFKYLNFQKIRAVTINDIKRVAQQYMTKIFTKSTEGNIAIVGNKNEGVAIAEAFKK